MPKMATALLASFAFLCTPAPDVRAQAGPTIVQTAAGFFHTVAVDNVGNLWAWGLNSEGQLGDGTTSTRLVPVLIGTGYSAVAAGDSHTVALKSDGSLWAWGNNGYGQLGDGTGTDRLMPVPIGTGFAAITAGQYHTSAVRTDGSLWAWGRNSYGQIGDGTTTQRLAPVQVIGTDYAVVAAGHNHTVAIKSDGSLWTWGYNFNGELGDGTKTGRSIPAQIGTGYSAIAVGYYHCLALRGDGSLWAWGYNGEGQLGDGTTTQQLNPVQVTGAGYAAIAAGHNHSVALKSDGGLWAWGRNSSGQLGDGTFVSQITPTMVIGTGYAVVAADQYQTVAIMSDGSLWTWGSNSVGQLGDGTTTNRPTPGQVEFALPPSIFTADLESSFNLIGNSLDVSLNVAAIFGNLDAPVTGVTANIVSIWKWNAVNGRWAFYSPQLTAAGIAAFAASKGYDVLAMINAGEGYWINAAAPITLPAQTGPAFVWNGSSFATLSPGFNLIATESSLTPSQFNIDVSAAPPGPGVVPTDNFVSLWAWDALAGSWYFYSPLLESSGGLPAVKAYADSHFFRHFQDFGKEIDVGVGFWVNRP